MTAAKRRDHPLLNLACNIVIPAVILSKWSDPAHLGPQLGLLVALAFPVVYGIRDVFLNGRPNFIAVLGFVSTLLTGGLGLLQFETIWFAVKEAAVPSMIGVAFVGSLFTRRPLVKAILYSEGVVNVPKIEEQIQRSGRSLELDRLLRLVTWLLAGSFFLSAVLNFVLAYILLKAPAGTPEFNEQLGRMTALSYPVIVLPCLLVTMGALWILVRGLKGITGLPLEEILHAKK